eukprot:GHVS01049168.1.p1 GENE.GHVS01049168.1~~GHVS01049168.1.p1  ORF type:complete len:875 (+),score=270.97 GHVS01049168.1:467-3091(+)
MTSPPPSHYEVLGVPASVDDDEIRRAFRKAALEWHPDKNLNNCDEAHDKFKAISEAYKVLSEPLARRDYDNSLLRSRRTGDRGGGGGGAVRFNFRWSSETGAATGDTKNSNNNNNKNNNNGPVEGGGGSKKKGAAHMFDKFIHNMFAGGTVDPAAASGIFAATGESATTTTASSTSSSDLPSPGGVDSFSPPHSPPVGVAAKSSNQHVSSASSSAPQQRSPSCSDTTAASAGSSPSSCLEEEEGGGQGMEGQTGWSGRKVDREEEQPFRANYRSNTCSNLRRRREEESGRQQRPLSPAMIRQQRGSENASLLFRYQNVMEQKTAVAPVEAMSCEKERNKSRQSTATTEVRWERNSSNNHHNSNDNNNNDHNNKGEEEEEGRREVVGGGWVGKSPRGRHRGDQGEEDRRTTSSSSGTKLSHMFAQYPQPTRTHSNNKHHNNNHNTHSSSSDHHHQNWSSHIPPNLRQPMDSKQPMEGSTVRAEQKCPAARVSGVSSGNCRKDELPRGSRKNDLGRAKSAAALSRTPPLASSGGGGSNQNRGRYNSPAAAVEAEDMPGCLKGRKVREQAKGLSAPIHRPAAAVRFGTLSPPTSTTPWTADGGQQDRDTARLHIHAGYVHRPNLRTKVYDSLHTQDKQQPPLLHSCSRDRLRAVPLLESSSNQLRHSSSSHQLRHSSSQQLNHSSSQQLNRSSSSSQQQQLNHSSSSQQQLNHSSSSSQQQQQLNHSSSSSQQQLNHSSSSSQQQLNHSSSQQLNHSSSSHQLRHSSSSHQLHHSSSFRRANTTTTGTLVAQAAPPAPPAVAFSTPPTGSLRPQRRSSYVGFHQTGKVAPPSCRAAAAGRAGTAAYGEVVQRNLDVPLSTSIARPLRDSSCPTLERR